MICRFRTNNDRNGNARRLWVVTVYCQGWSNGKPIIEPYSLPLIIRDEHGNRPELVRLIASITGAEPLEIDISPSEYGRLLRLAQKWTESEILQEEKGWVKE